MQAKPKTVLTILIGAIVAITPALLGYMQNRDEIKAKYQASQENAAGGYAALAASVKELQGAVAAQHDYIVKLEAHVEYMNQYVLTTMQRLATRTSRPHAANVIAEEEPAKPAPRPPEKVKFDVLPDSFQAAGKMYNRKQ